MSQTRHRHGTRRSASIATCVVLWLLTSPNAALAHGGKPSPMGTHTGLAIPPIPHGQMVAVARHASEIRRSAYALLGSDADADRLDQFIEYQSFLCVWAIVPGSVTDGDNPFNECAHAYLAAVRALLGRLESARGDDKQVRDLVDRIAAENDATIPLCQFSDEGFFSGNVIYPDWTDLPHHPDIMALLAGLILLAGTLGWMIVDALQRLLPPPVTYGAPARPYG